MSDVVGAAVAQRDAVAYVVQVRGVYSTALDGDLGAESVTAWRDVATVEVPRRTKRKTVVERAIAQAGDLLGPVEAMQPAQFRVLSPEDARPFKVSTVARDPELRIEGA